MTDQIRAARRRLIYHTITEPAGVREDDQIWTLLSEGQVRTILGVTSGAIIKRWFNHQRPEPQQVSFLCDLLTATAVLRNCHVDFDPELTGALIEGAFDNLAALLAQEHNRTAIMMIAIAMPSLMAIHMNLDEHDITGLVDTVDDYISNLPTNFL